MQRDDRICLIHNIQIESNILEYIYHRQVILEHLFIRNLTIYGLIRVHNRDFNKQVLVHLTIDQWQTFILIETSYFAHYSENNTDSFAFEYTLPSDDSLSNQISFAICYRVNKDEFWDNNFNRNYTIFITKKLTEKNTSILARDYRAANNYSRQAGNLCGLKNLQGTCYMNSILQTLFLTESLREILLSKRICQSILVNELSNLFELISSNKYELLTPIPIKQILGSINIDYRNDCQQDAHEFLIYLLDYLRKYLSIDDLFQGAYKSIIKCQICSNTCQQIEYFTCLSLSIPFDNQCTLDDCWRYFQIEENLTDDEQWFCPKCQCYRSARKQFQIVKCPKILIIHFKRFQLDDQINWIKNHTQIYYPENNVNLFEQSLYTLYSVVNHDGTITDGHYTTYSKKFDLWFQFDDEKIEYLPIEKLHSNPNAYLLFYVNKSI